MNTAKQVLILAMEELLDKWYIDVKMTNSETEVDYLVLAIRNVETLLIQLKGSDK
jgi:hypothetical protein